MRVFFNNPGLNGLDPVLGLPDIFIIDFEHVLSGYGLSDLYIEAGLVLVADIEPLRDTGRVLIIVEVDGGDLGPQAQRPQQGLLAGVRVE